MPATLKLRRTGSLGLLALVLFAVTRLPEQFALGPAIQGQRGCGVGSGIGQQLATTSTGVALQSTGLHPVKSQTASMAATKGVLPLTGALAFLLVRARSVRKAEEGTAEAPPKPVRAKRIMAFDSMRFFLISYIVCGHFISFAAPSALVFKTFTQINVVVGAFFALSGYVAAYTTCEVGQKKAKDKITAAAPPAFIVPRVFGYWTLHLFVLLLFSPMFVYADNLFNGPITTAWHGFLSVTMTAAWFPLHAEVWNAPTWFLGALTFCTILQPYFTPIIAKQGKQELRRTAKWLTLLSLLPKIGYCYGTNAWSLLEGALAPKAFANLALFNTMRFNPVWAVAEFMLGMVACRLVMLDGAEEETPKTSPLDTFGPLLGMLALIALRATGVLALSDMIVRPCIFMPLFVLFLMGLHRASLPDKITDPLAKFMALKPLVWLGSLAFPIFIVHGPLGQLFYKKAIATKLFGGTLNTICGPWFFWVYLLTVGVSAYLLTKFFMQSDTVKAWSQSAQKSFLKWL